jgi:nitrate/TMAO reductase-like tetraheme cytochrome c subunit
MNKIFKGLILLLSLAFFGSSAIASVAIAPEKMSEESKECVTCHKKNNNGIVQQWGDSKHHRAKVGCYECHAANEGDKDAFLHGERDNKKLISIIVSPRDCANCHAHEVAEAENSHHAKAARILGSLDNLLAEVVEGNSSFVTEGFPDGNSSAAVNGCWQCHGSQVKVLEDGSLDPATWPNTGIGRINPDGSEGSCTACHARHTFSVEQARAPETCGKCHMGPDHPHIEIYNESKHGIQYASQKGQLGMDKSKWIPGEDFYVAPTCSTCHMGATKNQDVTHNVGLRISWNNRPPVSIRPEESDKKMGLASASVDWQTRRDNMQDVCSACHSGDYVENFYIQYDSLVELYNEKFAKPGLKLMKAAKPLLKPVKFSNKIDFIWFEIWHHEGRRARHGASMMAPDITHWHGTYEVARNFYTHLLPELEHLIEKAEASNSDSKHKEAAHLRATINEVLNTNNHKWFLGKMSPKQAAIRKKATEDFKAQFEK